jgi:hypothetical protein
VSTYVAAQKENEEPDFQTEGNQKFDDVESVHSKVRGQNKPAPSRRKDQFLPFGQPCEPGKQSGGSPGPLSCGAASPFGQPCEPGKHRGVSPPLKCVVARTAPAPARQSAIRNTLIIVFFIVLLLFRKFGGNRGKDRLFPVSGITLDEAARFLKMRFGSGACLIKLKVFPGLREFGRIALEISPA